MAARRLGERAITGDNIIVNVGKDSVVSDNKITTWMIGDLYMG
jgi:hypothetical protein